MNIYSLPCRMKNNAKFSLIITGLSSIRDSYDYTKICFFLP